MPRKFTLAEAFTDPKLECSLLAAIAANPEVYWEVLDLLPPEALTKTRQVYEQLGEAIVKNDPLPEIDVDEKEAPDPVAAARELADLYQRRLLAESAQKFMDGLYDKIPVDELINVLETGLVRAQQAVRELQAGRVEALSDLLAEVIKDAEARQKAVREGNGTVGLPSGIRKLDKLLGGFQPGLHLLAAEPGQGKTTLTLQISSHVTRNGWPVLYVSFEESLPRLALKVICSCAGLIAKEFADGVGRLEDLKRAARDHASSLAGLHFIEGTSRLTVSQLKAKALQIMTKRKADRCLVVVDYLQRWASGRREYTEFRHVVSALVSELRELSLRLSCPFLVISSQNRPGQGTANLISLKESGDLEYSADTALFLVESQKRTATPPARAVDLVVEKNRYGDRGTIPLIFRPDVGIFREEDRR
jgi:replicative DNA helicase